MPTGGEGCAFASILLIFLLVSLHFCLNLN